jgi:tRNA A37 threonylcarbamoyladenosine modification protein TsaB
LLATPDLLAAALAALGRRILVVGDGARRYRAELALAVPRLVVGSDVHAAPSAAVLARVGVARLAAGHTTDAISAQPLYLRDADVRVGWETRAPETPAPDDTAQAQGTGQALVDGKGVARA